jgi:hypothetical protein
MARCERDPGSCLAGTAIPCYFLFSATTKAISMVSTKPTRTPTKSRKVATGTPKGRQLPVRTPNGIPLRRKTVWAFDMDSAEFKAARRRDRAATRAPGADRDGMAFAEAALAESAIAKWWK